MSTIEVNKIAPVSGGTSVTMGDSGDTFTVTSGATFNASSSNLANRPNAQPIIINGDMGIWQRSTSTVTMSDGYYNVDRYRGENNVASSAATWSRSTSVPDNTGLSYSLQVDCTTADSTIASSEQCGIQQTIEAQNLQLLKWGTSDAEALTVAFWVKSNQTGQHSVALRKLDNTQYNQPKTYTISSADTWEKKVLTFSALTLSGGAIANDNGDGLQIHWKLSAGSDYQGTADTWTATNQGATAVSGDVNFLSSTSNNFYITGVQMEVGEYTSSTIPPFQHESYGDNLDRCSRYFQMIAEGNNISIGVGGYYTAANVGVVIDLRKVMRATPSITQNSGTNYFDIQANDSTDTFNTFTITDSSQRVVRMYNNTEVSGTVGYFGMFRTSDSSAKIGLDAEL